MPVTTRRALSHHSLLLLIAAIITVATTFDLNVIGASAQERQRRPGNAPQGEQRPAETAPGVLRLLPSDSVTEHTITIGGNKLEYTATAGTLSLYDQSGERSAAIFYTAYAAKTAGETANRPVTFAFNGGPGAGSAFLHLGLVGPRIVQFGPNNTDVAAPKLIDNPETWLAFTDLVLIDPVGTGWSRPAKADGGGPFWSVRSDAESMAKVIALYVSQNGRASSPKYILGESYGGFRAAKVARALQSQQGIAATGIIMLSPLTDGGLIFGGDRSPVGAALRLPSLAAAALEQSGSFSKEKLAEAERFASTDYLTTLVGPPPQGEAARSFYRRLAQLTGLPEDVVAKSRGFIRNSYVKNLRGREGKVVSPYDITFAVTDPFPEQDSARNDDPILDVLVRGYGGAFAAYAREELGFKTDITYILLASDISGKWDWGSGGRGAASISDDLRELLALQPSFRLLIAHGYSDMVTPYGVSRYVLDHLPPLDHPDRAQLRVYRGGHMFYMDAGSRKAFTADASAFYRPVE
jgi:carboxypeptidase C (cathepsin A)